MIFSVTTTQMFFSLAGMMLGLAAMMITLAGLLKYYIDAKVDPIAKDVKLLVDYMIQHEGRISRLEERTK